MTSTLRQGMRSRIIELRSVKASELLPDPRNWRRHPPAQRNALRAMMDEVGVVDAVIARETSDGLMLVDGHLRAGLDPDATLPVLVVDLDEAEAGQVLATLDPLAAMATEDGDALTALLDSITGDTMTELMATMHGVTEDTLTELLLEKDSRYWATISVPAGDRDALKARVERLCEEMDDASWEGQSG